MSLFADLFSCGRTRKSRETPAEPHGANANDTIGATPKAVSPDYTTANDLLTADTPPDVRAPNNGESPHAREHARGGVATDTKEHYKAVGEDQNGTLAVMEEKAKQSGGWMVERRVLVTATPPRTADAAPVESECEPVTNTLISVEEPEPVQETTFAEEVAPSALAPEDAADNVPIPKARAAVQLLDLPPGTFSALALAFAR
jgi:hypothetical protein